MATDQEIGDGMKLNAWWEENKIGDSMYWCEAAYDQFLFFRVLGDLCATEPNVISTHTSKSITLPVVEFVVGPAVVTIRHNFYDYKVSVSCSKDVDFDFAGLCYTNNADEIHRCYCEGFPRERVYGCYAANHKQFTLRFSNEYKLWCFAWLLKKWVGQ